MVGSLRKTCSIELILLTKMKHSAVFTLLLGATLLFGCAKETPKQTENKANPQSRQGLTEFIVKEPAKPRTAGVYSSGQLNFYWTSGDKLWVNVGTAGSPDLKQSKGDNIDEERLARGVEMLPSAYFYFDGSFTQSSYPVRYTGKGNQYGNQVNIKHNQAQLVPNSAMHLGESGDCAIGTATRDPQGKYHVTLQHKAAYLTFITFTSQGFITGARLKKIRVTASSPIAGTYSFNDNGFDGVSTGYYNSIELTLGGEDGFPIPATAKPSVNAATMVLAPGTYRLTVEYFLHDPVTNVTGTITKQYKEVTLSAGGNRVLGADLQVRVYDDKYYMWDAKEEFWHGFKNYQPKTNGASDSHFPSSNTDPRWYHENILSPQYEASESCKNCPNINEIYWYMDAGHASWDETELWATMGHLYKGGIWLKKLDVIARESGKTRQQLHERSNYYDVDFRSAEMPTPSEMRVVYTSKPTNITDYFFLPATGFYDHNVGRGQGNLQAVGLEGVYWTRTPSVDNLPGKYNHETVLAASMLLFSSSHISVAQYQWRDMGAKVWEAK